MLPMPTLPTMLLMTLRTVTAGQTDAASRRPFLGIVEWAAGWGGQ